MNDLEERFFAQLLQIPAEERLFGWARFQPAKEARIEPVHHVGRGRITRDRASKRDLEHAGGALVKPAPCHRRSIRDAAVTDRSRAVMDWGRGPVSPFERRQERLHRAIELDKLLPLGEREPAGRVNAERCEVVIHEREVAEVPSTRQKRDAHRQAKRHRSRQHEQHAPFEPDKPDPHGDDRAPGDADHQEGYPFVRRHQAWRQ